MALLKSGMDKRSALVDDTPGWWVGLRRVRGEEGTVRTHTHTVHSRFQGTGGSVGLGL